MRPKDIAARYPRGQRAVFVFPHIIGVATTRRITVRRLLSMKSNSINIAQHKPCNSKEKECGEQIIVGNYLAVTAVSIAEKQCNHHQNNIYRGNRNPHIHVEGTRDVAMKQCMQCTLGTATGAFPPCQNIKSALREHSFCVWVEKEIDGSKCKKHRCRQYSDIFPAFSRHLYYWY